MFDASPPTASPGDPPPPAERPLPSRSTRSFSDDTLEGLIDRSMDATLQAATDAKTLVEMLHLLLQRFRVQIRRLENEVAEARAERSQVQREVDRQREEAELAGWELRQQLERESAQARARLAQEMAAVRAAAEEEARGIRLAAERDAAALLADAQRRRTELLAELQPWHHELENVRQRLAREGVHLPPLPAAEDATDLPPARVGTALEEGTGVPPGTAQSEPPPGVPSALPPRPGAAEAVATTAVDQVETAGDAAPPAPAAAAAPPTPQVPPDADTAELPAAFGDRLRAAPPAESGAPQGATTAEVVFLRVPDTRRAVALEAAVAGLAGVTACRLQEFERGRLVLDVEHELGSALADRVRALTDFDVRLTSARDGHLEFQVL